VYNTDEDIRDSNAQLGVIKCLHTVATYNDWRRASVFHAYVTHEGKNY